jgi:hypothetical protein
MFLHTVLARVQQALCRYQGKWPVFLRRNSGNAPAFGGEAGGGSAQRTIEIQCAGSFCKNVECSQRSFDLGHANAFQVGKNRQYGGFVPSITDNLQANGQTF